MGGQVGAHTANQSVSIGGDVSIAKRVRIANTNSSIDTSENKSAATLTLLRNNRNPASALGSQKPTFVHPTIPDMTLQNRSNPQPFLQPPPSRIQQQQAAAAHQSRIPVPPGAGLQKPTTSASTNTTTSTTSSSTTTTSSRPKAAVPDVQKRQRIDNNETEASIIRNRRNNN